MVVLGVKKKKKMRSKSGASLLPTLGTAGVEILLFLLYVVMLHVLGMVVKLVVTGSPWDPWTAPWTYLLQLVSGWSLGNRD